MEDWTRSVTTDTRKTLNYPVSRTENLLEEICESFGTQLNPANSYPGPAGTPILVRLSQPVRVKHKKTEKEHLLQFQYTKFSRFHDSRWLDVYSENTKHLRKGRKKHERLDSSTAYKMIRKDAEEFGDFDLYTEVMNSSMQNLDLHRFEKALYFVVFDAEDIDKSKELEPFTIHDFTREAFKNLGAQPFVWMAFHRPAYFVLHGHRDEIKEPYDSIAIDFPKAYDKHWEAYSKAERSFPMSMLQRFVYNTERYEPKERGFGKVYGIDSRLEPVITMGFINQYLKALCLGRTF